MNISIRNRFRKIVACVLLPGLILPWYVPQAWANPPGGGTGGAGNVVIAPNLMILMANSYSMGNMLSNDTIPASDPSVYDNTTMSYNANGVSGTKGVTGPYAAGNASASKLYSAKHAMQVFLNPTNASTQNINFGFATYRMIYGVPEYVQQQSGVTIGRGVGTNIGTYYGSYLVPDDVDQANNNSGSQLAPFANDPANFFAESNVAIPATTRPSGCDLLPGGSAYYAIVGNGVCDTQSGLVSVTNICAPKTWEDGYGGTWTVTPNSCTNPSSAFFTPYSNPYSLSPYLLSGPGGLPIALAGNPLLNPNYEGNNYLIHTSYSSQGSGGYTASYSGDQMLVNVANGSIQGGAGQVPAATAGSGTLNVTASQVVLQQTSQQKAVDFALYPPGATTATPAPAGSIYWATGRIPARTIAYTGSSGAGFTIQPFSINVPAGHLPSYEFNSVSTSVVGTVFASPADEAGRPGSVSWTSTNTPYSGNVDLGNSSKGFPYVTDIGSLLGWSGETQYSCLVNGAPSVSGGCLNVNGTSTWSTSYPSATTASVTVQSGGGIQQTWTASYPSGTADPDAPDRNLVANGFSVNTGGASGMEDWSDIRPAIAGTTHGATTVQMQRPNFTSHMGPFLDLPDPTAGYTDQRALVTGFLGYQQMRNDGDDYHPQGCDVCNASGMMPYTQQGNSNPSTIPVGGYYGLSISSYSWTVGSELYDSLQNSYAYYAAYKQQDPYNNCRSNNLLLVIDGKEDARYIGSTTTHVVDPVPVAAALHQNLGVNVYVVIMSSETGDVAQANAIANAGGTNAAYQSTDMASLTAALGSVFASLANQVNTAPVAAPSALQAGTGYVYDTVDSVSPSQGHVDAYAVGTGGAVATTPAWDAASAETSSARSLALYSTGISGTPPAPGPLTLLANLDLAAFNLTSPNITTDTNQQATIVDYTINPSYPCTSNCVAGTGSPYLGGRAPNAFFGLIGSDNQSVSEQFAQSLQFLNPPNDTTLTFNTSYMSWASSASQANRPGELLFPDQDGFLYAVYQNGQPVSNPTPPGQLAWGWMPREFVANLQQNLAGANAFAANHYGDGAETIVDAQDANSNWGTYVLGSMYDTQTNYALQMSATGMPAGVVYDDYRPQPNGTALPHVVPPAYFRLPNGGQNTTYVVYLTNNSMQQPSLVVREVTSGTEVLPELALPFVPTSNYFNLNNVLYLGDGNGNLYAITLANGTTLVSSLVLNTVGSFFDPSYATDADHAIAYVGGIIEGSTPYVYAASSTRITVFDQAMGTGPSPVLSWQPAWTSYVGGAGTWSNGVYAPSTAGVMGATPVSGIQFLPSNALITDNPAIANNALIVPVTTTTANACSPGTAYYYLYNLLNGNFPGGTFTMAPVGGAPVGNTVTANILIGSGTAYSVSGSGAGSGVDLFGSSSLSGSQASGGVGVSAILGFTTGGPGNQFVWWQILNN